MRLAAALLVLLAPTSALADRTGFALDLDVGGGPLTGSTGDATDPAASPYVRFGIGAQHGPVAILAYYEHTSVDPADSSLDGGSSLVGFGGGLALRADLRQHGPLLLQAQAGYSARALRGGRVQRLCATRGGCDHGYFQEDVSYTDGAPWIAIDVGWRSSGDGYFAGVGAELGVGEMTLDRPGTLPDAHGAIVWLALHVNVGR